MNRKFTIKEISQYNSGFLKLMNEVNANKSKYNDREYIVNTLYGELSFYMDELENKYNKYHIISIHSQFDKLEETRKFHCNMYTGKWNFYEHEVDIALNQIKNMLFQVLN